MKKNKVQEVFFQELKKVPIVQVACEKTGISRQSVYRWKKEDKKFAKKMDKAIEDGIAFVNDMGESQLLTMIKEKNWPAIRFWLANNHKRYANKLIVTEKKEEKELTKAQKDTIKKALEFSTIVKSDNNKQHE